MIASLDAVISHKAVFLTFPKLRAQICPPATFLRLTPGYWVVTAVPPYVYSGDDCRTGL